MRVFSVVGLCMQIEFEPEYHVNFGNPDIDEKPPMSLEEMLQKVKPFIVAYEGIQNQEEWEVISSIGCTVLCLPPKMFVLSIVYILFLLSLELGIYQKIPSLHNSAKKAIYVQIQLQYKMGLG